MKPFHEMTRKQYREAVLQRCMKDFKVSRRMAERVHSERDTDRKHMEHLIKACEQGIELRRQVLDSLTDGERYRIMHDFPNLHSTYLSPETRAWHKTHTAAYYY